jgi:hypothetical protein
MIMVRQGFMTTRKVHDPAKPGIPLSFVNWKTLLLKLAHSNKNNGVKENNRKFLLF